jgi:uncharacterized 2Fe-2S/4Fe-4S cluster protein (DUF4445 family)
MVAVGNTAMHHLLAGLPVRQLGVAPYVPAVSEPLDLRAGEIGLHIAPGAYLHLPPNIAGYVGADHVAMLLATKPWESGGVVVALDIGTNTEITLARGELMVSCSCASGPAFEGAHIRDGMRAAPGAIERVRIAASDIQFQTVGDVPPVGICGSGILDVVAEMLEAGIIDRRGRVTEAHPAVRAGEKQPEFVLVPADATGHGRDIVVNRRDINEIQLAKAAIRTGIDVLLMKAGITEKDITEVIIAGAFGTYLDIDSAVRVGMLPAIPAHRFRQVGNAAGAGAKQMLIAADQRRVAWRIAGQIEYVELTNDAGFSDKYLQRMAF